MKLIKIILAMVFVCLIATNAFATNLNWDETIHIQTPEEVPRTISIAPPDNTKDFVDLPIDISNFRLHIDKGTILYSKDSATLVVLNDGRALYLDFNVPYRENVDYRVSGKVDEFILRILDSGYSDIEKQFLIWKYLGVEESALRITWIRAYSLDRKHYERIYASYLFKQAEKRSVGLDLGDAIKSRRIKADFEANGYSSITIWLRPNKDVVVNIPLGQKFDNAQGGNQNLGGAEPVTVYLPKGYSKVVDVKAYCINAHKGVPTGEDKLTAMGYVEEAVKSAITVNYAAGAPSTADSQARVWEETDGEGAVMQYEEMGITEEEMRWINSETSDDKDNDREDDMSDRDDDNNESGSFYQTLIKIFDRIRFW